MHRASSSTKDMANAADVVAMATNGDVEGVRGWIVTHHRSDNFANKVGQAFLTSVINGHQSVVEALLDEGYTSVDVRDQVSRVSDHVGIH